MAYVKSWHVGHHPWLRHPPLSLPTLCFRSSQWRRYTTRRDHRKLPVLIIAPLPCKSALLPILRDAPTLKRCTAERQSILVYICFRWIASPEMWSEFTTSDFTFSITPASSGVARRRGEGIACFRQGNPSSRPHPAVIHRSIDCPLYPGLLFFSLMRLTWLVFVERLLRGLGEEEKKVRNRDTCFRWVEKSHRIYIFIGRNTTAGQAQIQYANRP
jgi:hypothetical protein